MERVLKGMSSSHKRITMITNMAADITIMPLSHKDIFEKAEKAPDEFKKLVSGMIENLNDQLE